MKKYLIIYFLLFVLIFFSSFTIYYISAKVPSEKPKVQSENSITQAEAPPLSPKKPRSVFLIKYKDGKIILYKQNEESSPVLLEEYEIDISLLPEEDRYSLSEGITTFSFDEALQLIEDFSS